MSARALAASAVAAAVAAGVSYATHVWTSRVICARPSRIRWWAGASRSTASIRWQAPATATTAAAAASSNSLGADVGDNRRTIFERHSCRRLRRIRLYNVIFPLLRIDSALCLTWITYRVENNLPICIIACYALVDLRLGKFRLKCNHERIRRKIAWDQLFLRSLSSLFLRPLVVAYKIKQLFVILEALVGKFCFTINCGSGYITSNPLSV